MIYCWLLIRFIHITLLGYNTHTIQVLGVHGFDSTFVDIQIVIMSVPRAFVRVFNSCWCLQFALNFALDQSLCTIVLTLKLAFYIKKSRIVWFDLIIQPLKRMLSTYISRKSPYLSVNKTGIYSSGEPGQECHNSNGITKEVMMYMYVFTSSDKWRVLF